MFRLELDVAAFNVPFIERDNASHSQQVSDHVALDFEVQRTICVHRGGHVNLDEPGLEVGVNQDVKAEDLKTCIDVWDRLLKGGVQNAFPAYYSFDYELVDSFKEVFSLLFADVEGEEVFKRSETPLAAEILFILAGFEEFSVFFVDAVVSEVLELPVFRVFRQVVIVLSGEPS